MKTKKLEIIRLLKTVNCEVLKTGYKFKLMEYFFCQCDPDQKDPICRECALYCHKGHSISKAHKGEQICHCGINYHIVNADSSDHVYQKKCFFYDWSVISNTRVYYQSGKHNICLFCYNSCETYQKQFGFPFTRKQEFDPKQLPSCDCEDPIHNEQKSVFEKLKLVLNDSSHFENLSTLHLINLLFLSELVFKNLFQHFSNYIDKLKLDLKKQFFLFDPNIGFSSFNYALRAISSLVNTSKHLYYFPKVLKNFFEFEFIWRLLDRHQNTSKSVVIIKNNMISCFRKITFLSDMAICPFFTVKDLMNINPLLRIMLQSNVKEEKSIFDSYVNNPNFDFIGSIINLINSLHSIRQKELSSYSIIARLYSFCKIFSKYNLLTKDQITRICFMNEEIINNFSEQRKFLLRSVNENKKEEIMKEVLSNLTV